MDNASDMNAAPITVVQWGTHPSEPIRSYVVLRISFFSRPRLYEVSGVARRDENAGDPRPPRLISGLVTIRR